MNKASGSAVSKKTARQRAWWLLALFLVAGSVAYPAPANWLLAKTRGIIGINVGQISKPFVLGLDLQGGTHLEYEADVSKVAASDRTDALSGVRDVIERRVNSLGVSEPLIQTTQAGDSWRVTVELAGISDINQAIKLIGETPILAFKEQNDATTRPLTADEKKKMDDQNAAAQKRAQDLLASVKQPGADFAAIAKSKTENDANKAVGGDIGFIDGKADYADILALVKGSATGTIVDHVIERTNFYTIAKVDEVKAQGTEVHAQHILISYKGAPGFNQPGASDISQLTKDQALAKIQALQKEATPANFADLAAKNSQEPGAVSTKGDLGWFGKGTMVPEFENVVFPQKVGTISNIVETPFGYHLIYKIAERPLNDYRVSLIEVKRTTASDLVPPPDPWKDTKLTGQQLQSARVDFNQQTGAVEVALQFNDEGSKLFADITKRNLGKPVAIFLDGQPISIPTVQSEILGGQAVITGNYGIDEAKLLARRLNAGALPIPIKLIAQNTVGPTLGSDSLQKSLKAGLIGFLLVALFMIALYRLPGLISIIALVLYAALSSAAFKLIPITLTLSGIAGFVLSLGIAVDANVLIFERLKEELKLDKTLAAAMEDAFRRAWPSIRDGHVTVLISCAVLYWFSSSIIRGFALTLAVGTVLSLFTAVVSSRTMLRVAVGTALSRFGWLFLKKAPITKSA